MTWKLIFPLICRSMGFNSVRKNIPGMSKAMNEIPHEVLKSEKKSLKKTES